MMTTMLFSKDKKIVLNKYHHHHLLWLQCSCRWNRHSEEQPAEIIILLQTLNINQRKIYKHTFSIKRCYTASLAPTLDFFREELILFLVKSESNSLRENSIVLSLSS